MDDHSLHIQVRQYLAGELEEQERLAFEERCTQDEALQAVLKLELQSRWAAKQVSKNRLESQPLLTSEAPNLFTWVRAAAVFIGLLLIGAALYIFWPSTPTAEGLYASYYFPPVPTQVRDSEEVNRTWISITAAYTEENWKQASDLIEQQLRDSISLPHPQAYLMLGVAYLEMDDYSNSQRAFHQLSSPTHPYYFDARWYSALGYLKSNELELAKEQLKVLSSSNVYRDQAAELGEKIDKLSPE